MYRPTGNKPVACRGTLQGRAGKRAAAASTRSSGPLSCGSPHALRARGARAAALAGKGRGVVGSPHVPSAIRRDDRGRIVFSLLLFRSVRDADHSPLAIALLQLSLSLCFSIS
jgi:hypothetical protein